MVRTEEQVHAGPASGAGTARAGRMLALSKHEAAGNDFLVLVDLAGAWDLGAGEARSLCDRRRGVGADGLLVCGRGTGDAALSMVLFNADGSRAEMSGNGIRCLVQAAVLAGAVPPGTVRVATDAGVRTVELASGSTGAAAAGAAVDMGRVTLGAEVPSPLGGTRARLADVGNPHLVLAGEVDLGGVDLTALHRDVTDLLGSPVNVEVVRPGAGAAATAAATAADGGTAADGEVLELRVFERGVGETAACGTGSCAVVAVARSFGMVGDRVWVVNPGGILEVRLAGDDDPVVLAGPVRRVAEVSVDPASMQVASDPGATGLVTAPGARARRDGAA